MANTQKTHVGNTLTSPRIRIKRALVEALKSFQDNLDENYQFEVRADNISFLNTHDWNKAQRMVVLYLKRVEKSEVSHFGVESATFSAFCIVSPDSNDDTVAFEGLNLLADQVRCCFWGCGSDLGFSRILPKDIVLNYYSSFSFEPDVQNRMSTERLVSHGEINFEIRYQAEEYKNIQQIVGSGAVVA